MRIINDLIGLAGLTMVGGGLWLYEPRIALIVVGNILLFVAYKGAMNSDP